MKKFITDIRTLAALLMAGAAFTACSSSDDNITGEQPANPTGKYTMTINASKGDGATTRALTLNGKTLNATWDEGEEVLVYQGDSQIGTLYSAASTTNETSLTGTLDSAPDAGQYLTLYFHTNTTSYSGQDGTLATIASSYDFCAPATVATGDFTVNSANHTISVPAGISFGANQQAIIKFTLKDKGNSDSAISPSALTVTDGTSTVSLTDIPAATYTANEAAGVLYVAFPAAGTAKTVTLTATVGTDTYTYEKSDVTFTNGQYYEITVKMTKQAAGPTYPVALSAVTADYYGSVICADGTVYPPKTAVPSGCTAVGILGKVTETGHGLILALKDPWYRQYWAINESWNTINGWESVTAYAGTTLKLLPDGDARDDLKSYTTLGSTAVSNWCVAQKSDYDAIFTNLGSMTGNNGKVYDSNVNAYITGAGGTGMSGDYWSATEDGYWGCTFNGAQWRSIGKTNEIGFRPVLGF